MIRFPGGFRPVRLIPLLIVLCLLLSAVLLIHGGKNEVPAPASPPAAVEVDPEVLKQPSISMDQLQMWNGEEIVVQYDATTSNPKEIKGIPFPNPAQSVSDAFAFLLSLREVFQIQTYEYACTTEEYGQDRWEFCFQQLYQNIPVEGAMFQVLIFPEEGTATVRGTYETVEGLSTDPDIPYKTAAESLALTSGEKVSQTDLMVLPKGGSPHLCWRFCLQAAHLEDSKQVYIDAETGDLLYELATVMT